jgi:hypothetical protein
MRGVGVIFESNAGARRYGTEMLPPTDPSGQRSQRSSSFSIGGFSTLSKEETKGGYFCDSDGSVVSELMDSGCVDSSDVFVENMLG